MSTWTNAEQEHVVSEDNRLHAPSSSLTLLSVSVASTKVHSAEHGLVGAKKKPEKVRTLGCRDDCIPLTLLPEYEQVSLRSSKL